MKKIIENYLEDKMIKEKKAKTTGKTKKWYENLRKITKEHIEVANSIEEFKENFLKNGYNIKFSEKNITVTDKENRSVRLKTLDKTYTNEYIFDFFERKKKTIIKNEQVSKRIGNKKYHKNNLMSLISLRRVKREFGSARFATRKFK